MTSISLLVTQYNISRSVTLRLCVNSSLDHCSRDNLGGLELLEDLRELLPIIHDGIGLALFGENLSHLIHLLLAVLNAIDTNVADEGDTSTHSSSGTTLAVLHSDALLRPDAKLLARVQVDLWVRLAGWRVEGSGGAVDVLVGEVVVNAGLLQRSDDTRLSGSTDNGHWVALLLETFQLLWGTWAGLALF